MWPSISALRLLTHAISLAWLELQLTLLLFAGLIYFQKACASLDNMRAGGGSGAAGARGGAGQAQPTRQGGPKP